jgi:hypothetical protein
VKKKIVESIPENIKKGMRRIAFGMIIIGIISLISHFIMVTSYEEYPFYGSFFYILLPIPNALLLFFAAVSLLLYKRWAIPLAYWYSLGLVILLVLLNLYFL